MYGRRDGWVRAARTEDSPYAAGALEATSSSCIPVYSFIHSPVFAAFVSELRANQRMQRTLICGVATMHLLCSSLMRLLPWLALWAMVPCRVFAQQPPPPIISVPLSFGTQTPGQWFLPARIGSAPGASVSVSYEHLTEFIRRPC